jgi:hypothetical protein
VRCEAGSDHGCGTCAFGEHPATNADARAGAESHPAFSTTIRERNLTPLPTKKKKTSRKTEINRCNIPLDGERLSSLKGDISKGSSDGVGTSRDGGLGEGSNGGNGHSESGSGEETHYFGDIMICCLNV